MKSLHSDFEAKSRIFDFFGEIVGEFTERGILPSKSYLSHCNIEGDKIIIVAKQIIIRDDINFRVIRFDVDFISPFYNKWLESNDFETVLVEAIISNWQTNNLADKKQNLERTIASQQHSIANFNKQIENVQNAIEENLIKLEALKLQEQTIIN